MKYKCPICLKMTAYKPEFGMADSIICKCNGLQEVGRIVNGYYLPNNINDPTEVKSVNLGIYSFCGFNILKLESEADVQVFQDVNKCNNAVDKFRKKYGDFYACVESNQYSDLSFFFILDQNKAIIEIGYNKRIPDVKFIREIIKYIFN